MQTTLTEYDNAEGQTGFSMTQYKKELDSIVAGVIPDKTDPFAN